jgi:hypothetical protein
MPELLSLPIRTRLGPRLLYARKRQVKLLLPSQQAAWPTKLRWEEWLQHNMVPLELWLTASEKHMCAAAGLSLEDYTRWVAHDVKIKQRLACKASKQHHSTPAR